MADQEEFQSAESGASATYPAQCSSLRKNGNVVIKGKPCKIVEMSTSKTGKHGHAKVSPSYSGTKINSRRSPEATDFPPRPLKVYIWSPTWRLILKNGIQQLYRENFAQVQYV